jgi:hypothetical protein
MISTFLQGGLGNYLFQISTAISLGQDVGSEVYFNPYNSIKVHRNILDYQDNILRNVQFQNNIIIDKIYKETDFSYNQLPLEKNLYLLGYFQSENYFNHNRDLILNLFEPSIEIKNYILNKYPSLNDENSCSIHIRRGDYVNLKDHHPVTSLSYYQTAINTMNINTKYFIFSDDIEWCKQNFIGENYIFVENEEDYISLYMISLCKDNINANSTFSWWGSWLNKNDNKKVIFPSLWFGEKKKLITKDIYPEKCCVI